MARHLTTSTLIASAVRRGMIPVNQNTFKEEDFLAFANEEMDMAVIPYVMGYHEDYFLFNEMLPILDSTSNYPIPYRAVGNKLRDVQYVDNGGSVFEMTRIGAGDVPYFQFGPLGAVVTRLRAFSLQGDEIVLSPRLEGPSMGGALTRTFQAPLTRPITSFRDAPGESHTEMTVCGGISDRGLIFIIDM